MHMHVHVYIYMHMQRDLNGRLAKESKEIYSKGRMLTKFIVVRISIVY